MSDIQFDILNYIDLRGPEVKEIFKTIKLKEKISDKKIKDLYVVYNDEIPNYFENALKLLKQIKVIKIKNENGKEYYRPSLDFPELSFEINFLIHISKLKGKYRITYDIYNELFRQDQIFMRQSEFQPWCVRHFGDSYNMTDNSASFWINIMDQYGFIQKLGLGRRNYIYFIPRSTHLENILSYYIENESKEFDNESVSISDFSEFIVENFFNIFTKDNNLSQFFQDWIKYMRIQEKLNLISLSDAKQFNIKDHKFSHFKILRDIKQ